MRKRYGKFLLALVLALTLLTAAGCDIQVPSTPTAPVNPGTEQTDPQDKPETPDTPDTPDEPDTPDTSEPSGQDQYHTDPVPQGKPQPVEPEETKPDTSQQATCTISISCATILNNMDKCEEAKRALIPADGTILAASTVTFSPGESVFDVLQRVCKERKIPMSSAGRPSTTPPISRGSITCMSSTWATAPAGCTRSTTGSPTTAAPGIRCSRGT